MFDLSDCRPVPAARRIHWLLPLLLAAAGVSLCAEPASLDDLLEEITLLSWNRPQEALDLAAEKTDWIQHHPQGECLLAGALAPAVAWRDGLEASRENLERLLAKAVMGQQPDRDVPALRAALADIALRHGEIQAAKDQVVRAFEAGGSGTRWQTRRQLLELSVRLKLAAGLPLQAHEILKRSRMALPLTPGLLLLEAEVLGALGDLSGMEAALDAFATRIDDSMPPAWVHEFWIQQVWFAIRSGRRQLGREYLQVLRILPGEAAPETKPADYLLLKSLLMPEQATDSGLPEDVLESARLAFRDSTRPFRFAQGVLEAIRMHDPDGLEVAPDYLLEALRRVDVSPRTPYLSGWQLLAEAEVQRRNGLPEEALENMIEGHRQLRAFYQDLLDPQEEILLQSGLPDESTTEAETDSMPAYLLTLLVLLLVALVLFLVLRIRMERHLNHQLRESVQRARRAEQEAETSNRLKSQFLANVSHEIKTPMSGLIGMASLLDELVQDPVQRRYLGTIQTCSRNLMVLINDMLDLGRAEAGHLEIERLPFRPRETLEYCRDLILPEARKQGLSFSFLPDPDLPEWLIGDSTRLGQVVSNLLNNAVKFTESGEIVFASHYNAGEGQLAVTVRDTGRGISPEWHAAVFEPFFRTREEGVAVKDGSGLGLAISRKLAAMMGGEIEIGSAAGKGSTFTLRLPLPVSPPPGNGSA